MNPGKIILYKSLKAIFLHIDNHEKALLTQYDLSVARFYALMHIHDNPGINHMELSDLMLCTKGNTTRIVAGLQSDGLISRDANPHDGRIYQLTITPKGEALFDEVHPEYLKQVNQLMDLFTPTELEDYSIVSRDIESRLAPAVISSGGL